jgi:hypothetical protein
LFIEIVIVIGSSTLGAFSIFLLDRTGILRKGKEKNNSLPIDSVGAELESLQFEKNLISGSITRVHEAKLDGKIDIFECDKLLFKYREELKSCNEKIKQLEEVADLDEILRLRCSIVSILETRIAEIDNKLDTLSSRSLENKPTRSKSPKMQRKTPSIERGDDSDGPRIDNEETLDTAKRRHALGSQELVNAYVDKDLEALNKEIIQALDRLETAGTKSDDRFSESLPISFQESESVKSQKKDALSFLEKQRR